ncbi:MAG: hypothetical protein DRN20_04055 [Thermoplasmata archaeon]|nr:MAG: hypothetical protein DRN20_04055 [Thermoplasmata archaeon]
MRNISDIKASDIVSGVTVHVGPSDRVSDIIGKMIKHNVEEIPVVDGKKLVGLVGYSALIKRRKLPMVTSVEHIMYHPPRIDLDKNILEVAEIMLSTGIKHIPVTKKDKLVGMITIESLMRKVMDSEEMKGVQIRDIMTPTPKCVAEDDTIWKAKALMAELDESVLPVVDRNGKFVGIVSMKSILRYIEPISRPHFGQFVDEKKPPLVQVKSIMASPAPALRANDTISKAIETMLNNSMSAVVVVDDDGKPMGIVGEDDILEYLVGLKEREDVYVQISGLAESAEVYDGMYSLIGKALKRIAKYTRPLSLIIHVSTYHHEGGEIKYSMHTRLSTTRKMYYARAYDWDLFKALSTVLEHLEKQVRKDKKKHEELSMSML